MFVGLTTGEWWNGDVDAVENEMMLYGGGPNSSDAYTINGLPGPLYPCSKKGNIGNCEAFSTMESKNVNFLHKFCNQKDRKAISKRTTQLV